MGRRRAAGTERRGAAGGTRRNASLPKFDALVLFGTITGIDPASFGENDRAHTDLGIAPADAIKLQHVASEQLMAAGLHLVTIQRLRANPASNACKGAR